MLRALALSLLLALAPHCPAWGGDLPFCPGETLTYSLRWQAIPAGEAVLRVLPPEDLDGVPAQHFRLTATSNAFVDAFYKVRDVVDAYTDRNVERSLLYVKRQREGSYHRDITVNFLWDKGRAQYSNLVNGPKEPIVILPGTMDPLSVFYAFRAMPVAEGVRVMRPVSDGVKCVIGEAAVLSRQEIEVPAGRFDTFLVEPDLAHVGGVFKKSKDAKLRVWVTADERHIPVKVASKVVVGHFYALLVGLDHPADCARHGPGG
ncbi:DUF3108 domain-containing protein [Desulfocurvus sp. DL9XJH121]